MCLFVSVFHVHQVAITVTSCLCCCLTSLFISPGKAIWKLDDPAVLAAERAERLAAAAEAARRKVANALDKKVRCRVQT